MTANDMQILMLDYMNAATELAESVRQDLRKGDAYSNETVLKLSQFKAMAEKVAKIVSLFEQQVVRFN